MRARPAIVWKLDSWRPDLKLWGGHPDEIMTDYPGKPAKSIGQRAGLASVYDFGVEWDPERVHPDYGDGSLASKGWRTVTLPSVADRYTFSDSELVVRYHETKGQMVCVCGYCEAKLKSRNLQKLRTWFREHDCITPYASKP